MPEKFNKFFTERLIVLFILFLAANIVALLPSLNIFTDICSQFRLQYFYFGFVFFGAFLYLSYTNRKAMVGVVLSFWLIVANYLQIASYCIKPPEVSAKSTVKVALYNVLTKNNKYNKLLENINLEKPDIIILQEVDGIWLARLEPLKEEYPYYIDYPREDNFGIALYSKMPLIESDIEHWTRHRVPVVSAKISIDDKIVNIFCVHTLPPVNNDYLQTRNEMLRKIGHMLSIATTNDENMIVAGDLNTTFFSPAYNLANPLFNLYPIYDAIRYTNGVKGTWNASMPPFLRISLEHILTTKRIIPIKTRLGKGFGSDHLPVFSEFAITE